MIARSGIFQIGLMLAVTSFLSMTSTAADAYSQEQEQMCTGDAFRLCSSDIPDVDRVTACMVRNKSQLSPGCRAVFRPAEPEREPAQVSARPRKPLSIKPAKPAKSTKSIKPKKPRRDG